MKLAWLHLRVGIMNELQYRANFFIQLLQSLVSLGTGLVVLSLLFQRTTEIAGWSRPELLIVMGVFTMIAGIVGFAIEPNMGRLIDDIQKGTLDFALTKPADTQLLVSVREFRVWKLADVVLGIGVLIWGAAQVNSTIQPSDLAGFIVTLTIGIVALYCFWLMLSAAAFWLVRVGEIQELFAGLYRSGQYPIAVYPGWLRFSLTFLVPLAIAITIPAEALTSRLTAAQLLLSLGFVIVLTIGTRLFWRAGLRRYSGASA